MTLSQGYAKKIALDWLRGQEDLHSQRWVTIGKYDAKHKNRLCSVICHELSTDQIYCLMDFYVYEDGSIELRRDRRAHIRQLFEKKELEFKLQAPEDPQEAGRRFFELMRQDMVRAPGWLIRIEQRTTDNTKGTATVQDEKGSWEGVVRLRVVTTAHQRRAYYRGCSPEKATRTLVQVVRSGLSDKDVRQDAYSALERLRNIFPARARRPINL